MIDRTVSPKVHDVPLLPIPQIESVDLPNGITLHTLDNKDYADVTRITFSWNGGSFDSPMPYASAIATRLVIAGSIGMDSDTMADLLDSNGAWLSTELIGHNNTITLFSLNRTLDTLLGQLVDTINRPLFPTAEFTAIKAAEAANRATSLQRVSTHAEALDRKMAFGSHHPIAREYSPDDIMSLTIDDIIADSYLLKGEQAPTVFLVGRISPDIRASVVKHLSSIQCNPGMKRNISIIPAERSGSTSQHREIAGSLQSAIRITLPTINRSHPDYEAIRLTVTALGGYFGSRLMTNIREEKGLTYGINAAVYGYREGAFITISSQCDNNYTERVIQEVKKEIEKLATYPMDTDELRAVKQTATGSMLTMLDTPFNIMDYYIVRHHMNTPHDYFDRQQRAIASLTPQLIRDTAARYLTNVPVLISTAGVKTV